MPLTWPLADEGEGEVAVGIGPAPEPLERLSSIGARAKLPAKHIVWLAMCAGPGVADRNCQVKSCQAKSPNRRAGF